ncbi:MAG: acetoin dehydrogenase dihydrolipoyllysine-residue acetyltransferase subunit [Geminicoccaceae bacterium]|nr:MAG: acetoin dehydrogenase dihydrolipoyllysine-residue acetyltransferase subunit [Geminicoccaceae bacterium]
MSQIHPIVMPKWGLAMQEGMVATWHVAPGQTIKAGQELCDIETSKIANVFEAPMEGKLRRLVAAPGATLPVGALLAVIADDAIDDAAIDGFVEAFQAQFASESHEEAAPEPVTITTPAGRIRYLKLGETEGAPVIFVHGFGGDYLGWMFNQGEAAAHATTYALDLPGHGGSTKDVGDGSLIRLVDAVAGFMDGLAIERAHLVGHSMGGAVALDVAARAPERVASLLLLAPADLGPEINREFIEGFIKQSRPKKLREVLEHLVVHPEQITHEMIEEVIKFKRLDGAVAALEKLRDGFLFVPPGVAAVHAKFRALACPVHVVWGSEDRILAPGHAQGLPPNVAVTHLEGVGHLPHMERAAEVNTLIERMIRG